MRKKKAQSAWQRAFGKSIRQPVNAQAGLGLGKLSPKLAAESLDRLRHKATVAKNPERKKQLLDAIAVREARQRANSRSRLTGESAIEAARKALERAQWARRNGR